MAWKSTKMNEQRKEFIDRYQTHEFRLSDLCKEFSISRPTAYKWIERFLEEGEEGLKDRSRARLSQNRIDKAIENQILQIKYKRMSFGAKKILPLLLNSLGFEKCPSRTTIENILKKHGLVSSRKLRKKYPAKSDPLSYCTQPNDVWCIDFKGWFKTKDFIKCEPLTLSDAYSRFLLHCSKIPLNTTEYVWNVLLNAFDTYGLPIYLRHDNGPPFATGGAGRLSRLSINLIKAGVTPEWIEPGKPYQNGRHERMHRTLKEEGIFNLTLKEQEMRFREFIEYYNLERPHESLGQKTPQSIYVPSERKWQGVLKSPEYESHYIVKEVTKGGQIGWKGKDVFIGKTLAKEPVGIEENEDGNWVVFYGPVYLGLLEEGHLITPKKKIKPSAYKCRIF